MYLLFAPTQKFGSLPPNSCPISSEVKFFNNVAFCQKSYWRKIHLLEGFRDITPRFMVKLRKTRRLKNILFIAKGGLGDVMWTLPTIKQLKQLHPQSTILVLTDKRTFPVFQGFPYIQGVIKDNIWNVQKLIETADEVFDFGGVATFYKDHKKKEPVTACFDMAEIKRPKLKADYRPHLVITIDEGKQAEELLLNHNIDTRKDRFVTIATESSTPNRDWPYSYTKALTTLLIKKGFKVAWLSSKTKLSSSFSFSCECGYVFNFSSKKEPKGMTILCPNCGKTITKLKSDIPSGLADLTGKTSFRLASAIIGLSDLFIGPNSGLLVVATSLLIPSIGLYGAFDYKRLSKYYEKFCAISGTAPCAPCNEHWTECPKGHPSPCMKDIQPSVVLDCATQMINKFPRTKKEKLPIL